MEKFFTIKKVLNSKEQTSKDFDKILKTFEKPKSMYFSLKKETILKEQNEIYKIHDHSIVQEDTKNYLTSSLNPFEGNMKSSLSKKYFQ